MKTMRTRMKMKMLRSRKTPMRTKTARTKDLSTRARTLSRWRLQSRAASPSKQAKVKVKQRTAHSRKKISQLRRAVRRKSGSPPLSKLKDRVLHPAAKVNRKKTKRMKTLRGMRSQVKKKRMLIRRWKRTKVWRRARKRWKKVRKKGKEGKMKWKKARKRWKKNRKIPWSAAVKTKMKIMLKTKSTTMM